MTPDEEAAARVRSLDAERARPEAKPPTAEELLRRLIGTLLQLWRTPPDRKESR